jgi:hypothetical protein
MMASTQTTGNINQGSSAYDGLLAQERPQRVELRPAAKMSEGLHLALPHAVAVAQQADEIRLGFVEADRGIEPDEQHGQIVGARQGGGEALARGADGDQGDIVIVGPKAGAFRREHPHDPERHPVDADALPRRVEIAEQLGRDRIGPSTMTRAAACTSAAVTMRPSSTSVLVTVP